MTLKKKDDCKKEDSLKNEEDLKKCKSEVKNLRDAFTPGPKKRKFEADNWSDWSQVQAPLPPSAKKVIEDETVGLETLVQSFFSVEEGLQHVKKVVPIQMKRNLDNIVRVEKNLDTLVMLVQALEAAMGKPGKVFKALASPTVWGNLASYHELIDEDRLELKKVKGDLTNMEANVNALTSILAVYDKMIKSLVKNTSNNESAIKRMKTSSAPGTIGSLMAGIGGPSTGGRRIVN